MEKRYQVFISSTFADLEDERKKIMEAILELDCFPAGMEMFSAANSEQFEYIKGIIDQSDYYVIVIGGRYGSTDENGISYTEKEFDYAIEKNIPVFAFIRNNIDHIVVSKTDNDFEKSEKLKAFRKKVETGRLVTYWNEPYELKSKLFSALTKGFKMNPRDGWIKGNITTDNELLKQINELRNENEKIRNNIKKDSLQSRDMREEEIDEIVAGNILKKCSSSSITMTYVSSYDRKFTGTVSLKDILRIIGGRVLFNSESKNIQDFIGENIIEIINDIEDIDETYSITSYCFDEIKIKLYSLDILSIGVKDGREYIGLTTLGKKVFFDIIDVEQSK